MIPKTIDTPSQLTPRKAVLVGACFPETLRFEASMAELEGLAKALQIEPVGVATQNLIREDKAFYIGKGKVEEVRIAADSLEADLILFNNTLSPSQLTNLTKELELEVLDRTSLILNIFAERARTKEARMQVDYARLKYMLPRLVGLRNNLSRQGGSGVGGGGSSLSNRGAGEKKIELDRRRIERQMTQLRRGLAEVQGQRDTQRKRRERSGMPLVSLVGYTNAGKSTLLNLFLSECGADGEKQVDAADMLFATLDTSVRQIAPPGRRPFLLSDTVGFIDDLPTALVDAFRSTLEEALHADLILQVIDCSDPEHQNHIRVTEETLADLGAGAIPVLYVMNQADKLSEEQRGGPLPQLRGDRIFLSAKDPGCLPTLLDQIETALQAGRQVCDFLIPYADSRLEGVIRKAATVLSCQYQEDGIAIQAVADAALREQLSAYVIA